MAEAKIMENRSKKQLDAALKDLNDAVDIGNDVVTNLAIQRDKIANISSKTSSINEEVSLATRMLQAMSKWWK